MQGRVLMISIILCLFCVEFDFVEIPNKCTLSPELQKEIADYQPVVQKIFDYIVKGPAKGKVYNYLADFEERFGGRLSGSKQLEAAIDYVKDLMLKANLKNVHTQPFTMHHWVRSKEAACLLSPRVRKLPILGLGTSVATPEKGITAEVLVVKTFEELQARSGEATGKIVVFDQSFGKQSNPFEDYMYSVAYRYKGASKAAAVGAVAALIRSVTDYSISTPHTGHQTYEPNVTKIPVACITSEDADLLWRLSQKNGTKLVIRLKMKAKSLADIQTRNIIGEIPGKRSPEIVLTSGHIDSWDVGSGIMDDAAGAFISWYGLAILEKLKLAARRTLRVLVWSGEEQSLAGAFAYYDSVKDELDKFSAVMESDIGTFQPTGLGFTGSREAACIMAEILKLFSFANATRLKKPVEATDITLFKGIPQISLLTDNPYYFRFHHTDGDTLQVENSDQLDNCMAVWTASAYVLADISVKLPRELNKVQHIINFA